MPITLQHYLVLSALLFAVGLYGALAKRNAIVILMCIELMFNAVNVAMVGFNRFITPTEMLGQIFTIFIIVVAAAEVALGLAIVLAIFRTRETVSVPDVDLMKW